MSLIQFNNSTIQKLHAVKFAFSLIIKSIKSPPYMNHHPSTSKLAITNPMASSRAPISSILFNPLISHRTNPYMSQLHLNLLLFLLSLLCFLFLPLKFSIHTICLFPSLDHFGFLLHVIASELRSQLGFLEARPWWLWLDLLLLVLADKIVLLL